MQKPAHPRRVPVTLESAFWGVVAAGVIGFAVVLAAAYLMSR